MSSIKVIILWVTTILLITAPMPAHAYIDPGIISMLSQALYAIIFGGLAVWITKPWTFIKGLFGNKEPKE
jgi:uncharacterized MnhB-related membrane protein